MYVYIKTESNPDLYTVGHYSPDDKFHPESDHSDVSSAVSRVCELNGGEAARRKSAAPVAPSLRDLFAMHALAGCLAAHAGPDDKLPKQDYAAFAAYDYADAMLKAREGGK